ncbi:hypothetical protein [Nocardiopsis sp. MG754419]|uniref:hypothetical protein n=1 Tax=Nocardiopsis sp. MG754419 TaxID=2259865 RepID=UPI001BAAD0B1|nr:hypothetical protein [Nocardiopsis sp. MG754419]MBR8744178.1 hypothetical protein [Nocardiopsis sp. MG754419]
MFSSGQDPNDPGQGGVPSQRGMPDFNAHFEALRPDAPMPAKVTTTRTLMFFGGVSGMLLSLLFLMGLAAPVDAMNEALDQQSALLAEEGIQMSVDADLMRSMMTVMALVTGLYGGVSLLLGARLSRRTVGVYWGTVVFLGAAGLILLWGALGGEYLMLVPLGFTGWMLANMFSKEGRAYFGLL